MYYVILSVIFPNFRYVGEKYSDAQEAMEGTMASFYNHNSVRFRLSKAVVGQLVAVRGEDGDEVTRAQVIELNSPDEVKVRFFLGVFSPNVFCGFVFLIVRSEVSGGGIGFLARTCVWRVIKLSEADIM